ncbi:hypothetical protein KIW84_023637 [Lathyrus oleraceus]|uniref:Uncharacterized protein n=1 Tax=Pisum sativum TaxID=3888 RepID=A0A9D4YDH3_PEA|nr:hypothetical protein KIW84_023637 [Pisum sativum]
MRLLSTPSISFFPFLIPTTNHSNSSLQFQPHNSSNQLSSRRCSVTCTAVSIGSDSGDSFTAKRLFQTETAFGKWFGLRYLDARFDRSHDMFQVRAAELRKILVELGPTYIKIAQAISSRSDLIPP